MQKNKNWDSLAWIIIWIFILSFSLLWIMNILNFNRDTYESYDESINNYILKANSKNILSKLDKSNLNDNEEFYIYRDDTTKEFKILTWAINKSYSYIDYLWNKIDPSENLWKTYKYIFTKKNDILKHIIKPSEINNLVFHLDAQNINWDWTTPWDWSSIHKWIDLSWNWNTFYQNNGTNRPTYDAYWINWFWWVSFNWTNENLVFDANKLINNDSNCPNQYVFKEKSFAIVLKTWFDITSDQTVYEQWWKATWYNFMIHNWDLYAWIHNKAYVWWYSCFDNTNQEWDSWHKYKSVNLWKIVPDSTYFIMVVQDSTHKWETWNQSVDDSNDKLKIYLNWILASETDHVDPQPEHHIWWLWAINEWNVRPRDTNQSTNTIESLDGQWWCDGQCLYFKWIISEFISWNHALSDTEIRWIQNYFKEKWLGWKSNIIYNIVNSDIKKYNQ